MKRRLIVVPVILVAALAAFWLSRKASEYLTFRAQASAAISVQPFTLELRTTAGGKRVEDRIFARRSDGSESTTFAVPGGNFTRRTVLNVSTGYTTGLVEEVGVRMSGFMNARDLAVHKETLARPQALCRYPNEVDRGRGEVLGEEVYIVARAIPAANRTIRITEWRAVALSCTPVQALVEDMSINAVISDVRPVYIVRGEPMASLFDERAGYKEMKPSDLRKAVFAHYGVTAANCPTCADPSEWDKKHDADYMRAQSKP